MTGGDGRHPRWQLPDLGRGPRDPDADGPPPECFAPIARPASRPSQTRVDFDTVRRGYDPEQVDAAVRELSDRAGAVETERHRADIAEDQLREALIELKAARRRADSPPPELAEPSTPPDGFGVRAERVLREAEREAERERAEAVEQARQILARARAEAETLTHAAEAEAERVRREGIELAERDAAAAREEIERETGRLARVRDVLRTDLARLHRELGDRLDGPEPVRSHFTTLPAQQTRRDPSDGEGGERLVTDPELDPSGTALRR